MRGQSSPIAGYVTTEAQDRSRRAARFGDRAADLDPSGPAAAALSTPGKLGSSYRSSSPPFRLVLQPLTDEARALLLRPPYLDPAVSTRHRLGGSAGSSSGGRLAELPSGRWRR